GTTSAARPSTAASPPDESDEPAASPASVAGAAIGPGEIGLVASAEQAGALGDAAPIGAADAPAGGSAEATEGGLSASPVPPAAMVALGVLLLSGVTLAVSLIRRRARP
ncbi:MAG: hypothetical protein ACRDHL_03110, partial [Candidatus Promineifilaceae bacterium]